MESLKSSLLSLGVCVDNTYLDLYCALIKENLNTEKEKFKTQAHHFIPVCYYWYKEGCPGSYNRKDIWNNEAEKDVLNFKVNMLFMNHVLAHYYLCMCATEFIKQPLIGAYIRMTKSKHFNKEELSPEILDNYQELYEEFCYSSNHFRGKKHTEEWCKKHSEAMKGRITYIRTNDTNLKISNSLKKGYEEGKYVLSEEARARKSHKGSENGRYGKKYIHIYKDNEIKLIPEGTELPEGWSFERYDPVIQFDLEGNFIKEYYNINQICNEMDISKDMIHKVCKGLYKSGKGYIWKYKKDLGNE